MANPFDSYSARDTLSAQFQEEPFNPEHYIEKLARPNTDNVILGQNGSEFDPKPLRDQLKMRLTELETQFENKTKQVQRVEEINLKKQESFKRKTKEHDQFFNVVDSQYQDLDKVINFVSTKVVHLGDQLKQMDGKRRRALEAKELIDYINEAQKTGSISSSIFTDVTNIHESARVLHKITLVTQDLPDKGGKDFSRLQGVVTRITDEIEKQLVQDFKMSLHHYTDEEHLENMKRCAATLNQPCFQAYKEVVDYFIDARLKAPFYGENIFSAIKDCINETSGIVSKVFSDHDTIMPKFIKKIFKDKIWKKVRLTLKLDTFDEPEKQSSQDLEQSLDSLAELYSQTMELSSNLSKYDNDISFANDIKKSIFCSYLSKYSDTEKEYLLKASEEILNQFYNSIKHEKNLHSDALQVHLKNAKSRFNQLRDNIGSSNNLLSNEPSEMPSDQLLSVNVTTSLLKIHERAVERCLLLSDQTACSDVLKEIATSLLTHFVANHLEYAIDFYTANRPSLDSRNEPIISPFLTIVGNANITYHSLDKFFNDTILPNIQNPKVQTEVRKIRQTEMKRIEEKVSNEINHSINIIINWIKVIFKSKQEKEDFNSLCVAQSSTRACNEVCNFLTSSVIDTFKGPVDGDNLQHVMMELGVRFHGALLDHLLQYQYSIVGALQLIQDLHRYKQTVHHFKEPFVEELFEGLSKLTQLLIVEPHKLRDIWDEGSLARIEHGFLVQFVKLRADYRKSNIQSKLPSYSAQVKQ
ncbi:exocyst complex component 5-like [Bolinopsis microptera]|uniref:exocyst complex component 5-like n=1 Tax=Bolinopsis microptera TaxID=2820187 RepID=UPI003079FA1E